MRFNNGTGAGFMILNEGVLLDLMLAVLTIMTGN